MKKNQKLFEWALLALTAALVLFTVLHSYDHSPRPLILRTLELSVPEEGQGCLDINTATAAELEELPGIGPALARKIISWREENGPFTGREDVLAVAGIGEATYETIKPYISFG